MPVALTVASAFAIGWWVGAASMLLLAIVLAYFAGREDG